MRIAHQSPTELVVRDSSMWISAICAAAALTIIFFAITQNKPSGFLVAAFFLLFTIILARTSTFTFDGMQRMVRWRGYKPFQSASGMIPFDDISDITVDASSAGSRGTPVYRLSLLTSNGTLPMAYVYSGSNDAYASLRREILGFLKPGVQAPEHSTIASNGISSGIESSIRSLLQQGRKIDAIALLRTTERIGLTEAVGRIDAIEAKTKAETHPR
jgi:hypothetical protein